MKDKVVVVTGAAGGLGSALCKRFGKEGAKIAALDYDGENLAKLTEDLMNLGINARGYQCDVTVEQECFNSINKAIEELGEIDVLINNAGISHRSPFYKTKVSVLKRVIDVSLFGSIYCTSAAINSILKTKGKIIGISSIAGFAPLLGRTGYAAAKHGLAGFLGTLRTELIDTGVQVMLVYATYIKTNIDKNSLDAQGNSNKNIKKTTGKVIMPDEAAEEICSTLLRGERLLLLGEEAKQAYEAYRIQPEFYEKVMIEGNKHILQEY